MNNIKKYRIKNNMKQIELCNKLGITQGALSGWENGRFEPDIKSLRILAEIFNVSIDELLCRKSSHFPEKSTLRIPVYGKVAAGIPIEAIENYDSDNPDDWEEISEEMARNGEYMALRIHGDSMEPRFTEGDVVIVRLQETCDTGDIVIAIVNGDDAVCKKIKKMPEGIMLISTNSDYEPMYFSNKEIIEKPVRILGKVVELRAKF